ncbi:hypothetical protein Taro_030553 [Colocasia esculenta]|uniref:Uncharacterized protein n=1 Tax=Colocasia esculenta TaxID=4460 RepID=A0A843VPG7_COLES|nr:hypothetical protein [Colocasia esculenta]
MADRYVEGTPQPDLDPEAWVDVAGGPRKGRVYIFGDSLDTTPVLSSYASSVAPLAYTSSSAAPPVRGVEEMRTLIREELRTHFGDIVQQLISAMQGVRPSQTALRSCLLMMERVTWGGYNRSVSRGVSSVAPGDTFRVGDPREGSNELFGDIQGPFTSFSLELFPPLLFSFFLCCVVCSLIMAQKGKEVVEASRMPPVAEKAAKYRTSS